MNSEPSSNMGSESKNIVWLASYPKSGNTWFRVFLSNLLSEEEKPVNINDLHHTPIASSRILFDNASGVSSSDLTPDEIAELRPEVYRQVNREASDLVFHKVHDAWGLTPSGKPIFPPDITKAVIYFIRNPLDVAVSFAFHSMKSSSSMIQELNDEKNAFCRKPSRLYNQLMQPLSDWSGHVVSWVDQSELPLIVLRYEDMLEETYGQFTSILDFLGIKTDETKIRAALKASSIHSLKKMEMKDGFKEKPLGMKSFFRRALPGEWREHLSKQDVKNLVYKQRVLMERFGYLTENNLLTDVL